jgi:long-chain fatty acid transport protein
VFEITLFAFFMIKEDQMNTNCLKALLYAFIGGCIMLLSQLAFAAGFYVPELASPGSLGTAGVYNVINNTGADSAYTNPAGMTGLKNDQALFGSQMVLPEARFDSSIAEGGGSDGGNAGVAAPVPGVYAVKVLSDDLRLGISLAAPLGGGVDYGDNFVGRYQVIKAQLSGVSISPAIAYKVTDKLSVGVGISSIYTVLDEEIAVRQPGFCDGKISFDEIDDWSLQGYLGITLQLTDKTMLGFVYRSKAEADLSGGLEFDDIQLPILNAVTSGLDTIKVNFDYPELFNVGPHLKIFMDLDYENWSQFGNQIVAVSGADNVAIQAVDRNFEDTWHVGAGLWYDFGNNVVGTGVSYDSSPVDDRYRTADLPVDEQFRIAAAYGRKGPGGLGYAVGLEYAYLGEGKMDQTAQGVRFKGEFDTNYVLFAGAFIRYEF